MRHTCLFVFAIFSLLETACGFGQAAPGPTSPPVNFSYAFAPPHRITIGRPDCSDRTLLDCQPGSLRMAWSYDDLTRYPPAAFKTPPTSWAIQFTPQVDGRPFGTSRWIRVEECLPALKNDYQEGRAHVQLEVVGSKTAALTRVEVFNQDSQAHQIVLRCESAHWGENPAWVDGQRWTGDNLVAGWNERADRVLVLGIGADRYSLQADGRAPGPRAMILVWNLRPGEKRSGWVIRPYRGYAGDLPAFRKADWNKERNEALQEWRQLLGRATQLLLPDMGVRNAFRACLGDLFIMREPVAGGKIAAVPGTEVYRAPNAFEAAVVAVALDQTGYHREALDGYRFCLEMQEPDGNWADPKGWGHLMWGGSGFKAWAAMEHYRLTRDRQFLAEVFPRLVASSRWQEGERARSRQEGPGERSLNYGLMPRGFGDAGLLDDGDLYGIFLPHNIWAVYADRLALESAEILGRTAERDELRRIYERGRQDLLTALERGAIKEKEYRWIPGVAGKTSGSRWGALNAAFPCGLLPPDHALISGTLRKIESRLSPGGIPQNTGWLADGMWVAITLDNVAEIHLARGNGNAAAAYLYATLNHGSPLYTWCEERGPEAGSARCTGDRQHLWTPVAVVRALRDSMIREEGDGLQLALGADRSWLASGQPVGVTRAPTHFGTVSYQMQLDAAGRLTGQVQMPETGGCRWVRLYSRLPEGVRITEIDQASGFKLAPDGSYLERQAPRGTLIFSARVKK